MVCFVSIDWNNLLFRLSNPSASSTRMAPAAGGAKEMFTNLIDSDSHRQEFKRSSSFFFATVAAYALILFAAGVASIYAYDAHLEAQSTELLVDFWVPPVLRPAISDPHTTQTPRRSTPSNAPVDPHITTPERTESVSSVA